MLRMMISQTLRATISGVYVGDSAGFAKDMETTISGMASILRKTRKLTNVIVEFLRAFECYT
jgi:hypothetical protein